MAWEERLPGTLSEYLHSSKKMSSFMCFCSSPYRWSYDYAQSRASLSEYSAVWFDATGESVTWERRRRSQEWTSLTLSPMLLLKHLPREGILFSSTTPGKVSSPVITSHSRSAHRHRTDTRMQYPQDSLVYSFPVLLLGQCASISC